MNRFVAGDVITVVPERRRKERHQPNCVCAEFLHVIQFLCETVEIANTIAVAVIERAHMDLINDRVLVPTLFALQRQSCPLRRWLIHYADANRIAVQLAIRSPASQPCTLFGNCLWFSHEFSAGPVAFCFIRRLCPDPTGSATSAPRHTASSTSCTPPGRNSGRFFL